MDLHSEITALEQQIKDRETRLQELQEKQRAFGSAFFHPVQFNKNKKEIETLTSELEESRARLVELKAQLLRESAPQSSKKSSKKKILMIAGIAGGALILLLIGVLHGNKEKLSSSETDDLAASEKTTIAEEAIETAEADSSSEAAIEFSWIASDVASLEVAEERGSSSEEASREAAALTSTAATAPPQRNKTVTSGLEFYVNEYATISIHGQPGVLYNIEVYYRTTASTAAGLNAKYADSDGNVSWTWKIGPNTTPGTYPVKIRSATETITVYITVKK